MNEFDKTPGQVVNVDAVVMPDWDPCKCCGNTDMMQVRVPVWIRIGVGQYGPYVHCLACGELAKAIGSTYEQYRDAWNRKA